MNVSLEKQKKLQTIIPFAISTICAGASVFLYALAPAQIPLWYSLAIAEQHLVAREFIFLFPAAAFGVSLLHTLILSRTTMYETELKTLLWGFTYVPLFLFITGMIHAAMVVL